MTEEYTTYKNTDTDDGTKAKEPMTVYDRLAMLSVVVTIIAWVVLSFNGVVALIISALAFTGACFGLKASRRLSRNVAITSIVASSVLMVVVGAFLIVIYVGLSSV